MLTIQPTKKLADQLNNELNKEKTVEKQSLYAWHAHLFFMVLKTPGYARGSIELLAWGKKSLSSW